MPVVRPALDAAVTGDADLASLNSKLAHISDAVVDVIRGRATGLYLFGHGGTSKTYTVRKTFAELRGGTLLPPGCFDAAGPLRGLA